MLHQLVSYLAGTTEGCLTDIACLICYWGPRWFISSVPLSEWWSLPPCLSPRGLNLACYTYRSHIYYIPDRKKSERWRDKELSSGEPLSFHFRRDTISRGFRLHPLMGAISHQYPQLQGRLGNWGFSAGHIAIPHKTWIVQVGKRGRMDFGS